MAAVRARVVELTRFLAVGGVSFVVDLGLFNLLRFGPGELLLHKPLTAKVLSVAAATLVSWVGNRHWTFADHRTAQRGRELTLYAIINVLGVLIGVAALAFSHYVLDLRTPLADNVSTVLGIALGTVVRYVGYKRYVFISPSAGTTLSDDELLDAEAEALA
jgi:putative flippase GtrA